MLMAGMVMASVYRVGAVPAQEIDDPVPPPVEVSVPTEVSYTVTLDGSPNDEATDDLRAALTLYRFQDNGAPSVALLRRRAQDDREIAVRVLRSHGYFEASAEASVEAGPDATTANVVVSLTPGRPFVLEDHRFVLDPVPSEVVAAQIIARVKLPEGEVAAAQAILDGEARAVLRLQQGGYAYARLVSREAIADPENATLVVTTIIKPGPRLAYGPLSFEGIDNIDEEYLRTYIPWEEGETVDTRKLDELQLELMQTGLFTTGSVQLPETPPDSKAAPIAATMQQRPFRSIGVGLRYSTDIGPGGDVKLEHRNLFGANEIGSIAASAGFQERRIEARFRKPQFQRNRQDLVAGISARQIDSPAFYELGVTATLGLERQLSHLWRAGIGTLFEVTQTKSGDAAGRSYLIGVPAFAEYDNSDDLLNPSKGWRIRATVTPFIGQFDGSMTPFLSNEIAAATYFDLTGEKRYIAAFRGRLGSILTDQLSNVPAGRRLFSGGGGSIRGYANRSIGPLDSDEDPIGGLSVVEVAAELRARVYGDFGFAVFLAAGSVAEEVVPTFGDGVQFAAGLGLRYFSPLGPIRADVGVPLNPRATDDAFQIYFSIGQAF